jgi:twitching motility protein PilJ
MSANVSQPRQPLSAFGLRFWVAVLVVAALIFGANFGYASYLQGQENRARALTAELQVLSQQLAKYAREAVEGGNAESFEEFKATKIRIDSIVKALRLGGEGVPGYEGDIVQKGVDNALKKVTTVWTKMAQDADRIIKSENQIINLSDTASSFNGRIPQISARLDEVVRAMSDSGAPASQINLANRQIVLADRMSRRVTEILAGWRKRRERRRRARPRRRGVRPGAAGPEGRQRGNRRVSRDLHPGARRGQLGRQAVRRFAQGNGHHPAGLHRPVRGAAGRDLHLR